jgi:hypothetical protein
VIELRSTIREPFWCEVEAVVVVLREVQGGVDVKCDLSARARPTLLLGRCARRLVWARGRVGEAGKGSTDSRSTTMRVVRQGEVVRSSVCCCPRL